MKARFSAAVQTGPETHLASYTLGTGSFPGVKQPRRGVDQPHTSSDEVKERVEINELIYKMKVTIKYIK